ncbi:hypothetical protein [Nocardioides ochotonae]|uniref:hypothetical protein n=1 Tax=Nocardioides ochotonae TaxID=2685869 RepID=UPI00140C613C|nr:hypothetical protein [Nocardioides ochotonae]
MQPDYLMPVAGLVAVLVLLSVVVVMRRRRAAAEPDAVEGEAAAQSPSAGADTWEVGHLDHVEQAGSTGDPLVGTVHDARGEVGTDADPDGQVEVRWLRAQVHTLEQTLERLSSAPAPGEEPEQVSVTAGPSLHLAGRRTARPEAATPADAARYRRQVTATLRGLAGRTAPDEAPARTMARVVAAVERLESTETVARPVLPTVPAGTALAAPAHPRPAELSTPPAPPAASAPAASAAPAEPAAPEAPVEDTAPATRTVPEPPPAAAYDEVDALGHDDDGTEQIAPVAPVPGIAPVGAVPVGGARRSTRWSRRDASHSQGRSRS